MKGFTLIELMVVIVIIGILAAVAIPKMFGVSAKARVSEIYPAAGTYAKLQMGYHTEMASLGSWPSVGYEPPGTIISSTHGKTAYFDYSEASIGNWTAQSIQQAGNCLLASAVWTLTTDAASGKSAPGGSALSDPDCDHLSTAFSQLGK